LDAGLGTCRRLNGVGGLYSGISASARALKVTADGCNTPTLILSIPLCWTDVESAASGGRLRKALAMGITPTIMRSNGGRAIPL